MKTLFNFSYFLFIFIFIYKVNSFDKLEKLVAPFGGSTDVDA